MERGGGVSNYICKNRSGIIWRPGASEQEDRESRRWRKNYTQMPRRLFRLCVQQSALPYSHDPCATPSIFGLYLHGLHTSDPCHQRGQTRVLQRGPQQNFPSFFIYTVIEMSHKTRTHTKCGSSLVIAMKPRSLIVRTCCTARRSSIPPLSPPTLGNTARVASR